MAVVGDHTRLYGTAVVNRSHSTTLEDVVRIPQVTQEFFLDHRGKRWWVEEKENSTRYWMDERDRRF